MARKLSRLSSIAAQLALVCACEAVVRATFAEELGALPAAPNVVANPFVGKPQETGPTSKASDAEPARRPTATYQNPFANASKLPPMDTSLRPGPMSRWRRPLLPEAETSHVKSAILAQYKGRCATWDQLPPAETLRELASAKNGPAATAANNGLNNESSLQFVPEPLTQPGLLALTDDPAPMYGEDPTAVVAAPIPPPLAPQPIVPASANLPLGSSVGVSAAFNTVEDSKSSAIAVPQDEISPAIISDCADTPDSWLSQGQDAAANAVTVEDLTAVIECCDHGIHGNPSEKQLQSLRKLSAWAYNRRGELMSDAGHSDEAIQDFQVAITMDSTCSLAVHNRGVTLAQRNQFGAALRDFNRVIELNPGLGVAYRNRAELLSALNRMEDAILDYDRALEATPNDAAMLRDRAHAHQRLSNYAHAAADLTRAIELLPNDPDTLTQRGSMLAEQGRYQEALDDFHAAIVHDANWAEAYRGLAWLQATCADKQFRNASEALAAAKQAVDLGQSDNYMFLDTLAAAHASNGHFDEAASIQEKAIAAAPPDAATPLEKRLGIYKRGHAYMSKPVQVETR